MTLSGQCPVCRKSLALPGAAVDAAPSSVTNTAATTECECDCGNTLAVRPFAPHTEIEFYCANCGSHYAVDQLGAGEDLDCRCGSQMTVPQVLLVATVSGGLDSQFDGDAKEDSTHSDESVDFPETKADKAKQPEDRSTENEQGMTHSDHSDAAENAQDERLEAERLEAERLETERLETERLETERLETERLETERLEAERLEAERLEAERLEAERLEAERLETERLEAERLETERLETERLEAERLEAERLEAERLEAERLETERLEAERLEAERLETERLETERLETERLETERLETERLETERLETERLETERLETERLETERLETERLETERLETERLETERLETERLETERLETERLETERLEAERLETERLEAERLEAERLEAERLEAERLETERLEAERLEAERLEAERLEAERLAAERLEAERLETERLEAERLEAERLEAERLEAERLEAERGQALANARSEDVARVSEPNSLSMSSQQRATEEAIKQVQCPGCSKAFQTHDSEWGQTAECECGFVFVLDRDLDAKDAAFKLDLVPFMPLAIDRTGAAYTAANTAATCTGKRRETLSASEKHSKTALETSQTAHESPMKRSAPKVSRTGIAMRVIFSLAAIILVATSTHWLPASWEKRPSIGKIQTLLISDPSTTLIPLPMQSADATLTPKSPIAVASHFESGGYAAKILGANEAVTPQKLSAPSGLGSLRELSPLRELATELSARSRLGRKDLYQFADAVRNYGKRYEQQQAAYSVQDLFWLGEQWEKLGELAETPALAHKCYHQASGAYALAQTLDSIAAKETQDAKKRQAILTARSEEALRVANKR